MFDVTGFRKQAVLIFLQQMFGDTVERKVIELVNDNLTEARVLAQLKAFKDAYWPNGQWAQPAAARTEEQKTRSKFEASGKLNTLLPDLFSGIVGRQNAKRGASKLHLLFQNQRLNQHLMYKILDELLTALFPKL